MMSKIISGGQTGGDFGGLLAGKKLGIQTGGHCPAGWKTENGADLRLKDFGLICTSLANYPPRTRLNVYNSDATIGFGRRTSSGMKLTQNICSDLEKPYFHVDFPCDIRGKGENYFDVKTISYLDSKFWGYYFYDIDNFRDFIQRYSVNVLNVAGNRESKNPGIEEFVKNFLVKALNDFV